MRGRGERGEACEGKVERDRARKLVNTFTWPADRCKVLAELKRLRSPDEPARPETLPDGEESGNRLLWDLYSKRRFDYEHEHDPGMRLCIRDVLLLDPKDVAELVSSLSWRADQLKVEAEIARLLCRNPKSFEF